MTQTHPITLPPELRRQWIDNDGFPFVSGTCDLLSITRDRLNSVMDQAVSWGADQELEACKQFMHDQDWFMSPTLRMSQLHNARRPKPPSLKDQALRALRQVGNCEEIDNATFETICRALEALDD